jgi:hypothetical protein
MEEPRSGNAAKNQGRQRLKNPIGGALHGSLFFDRDAVIDDSATADFFAAKQEILADELLAIGDG